MAESTHLLVAGGGPAALEAALAVELAPYLTAHPELLESI